MITFSDIISIVATILSITSLILSIITCYRSTHKIKTSISECPNFNSPVKQFEFHFVNKSNANITITNVELKAHNKIYSNFIVNPIPVNNNFYDINEKMNDIYLQPYGSQKITLYFYIDHEDISNIEFLIYTNKRVFKKRIRCKNDYI